MCFFAIKCQNSAKNVPKSVKKVLTIYLRALYVSHSPIHRSDSDSECTNTDPTDPNPHTNCLNPLKQ